MIIFPDEDTDAAISFLSDVVTAPAGDSDAAVASAGDLDRTAGMVAVADEDTDASVAVF